MEDDENSVDGRNKVLRNDYRNLIEDYEKKKEESVIADPNVLVSASDVLEKANNLFLQVSRPREARLDSDFMCKYVTHFWQEARALNTNNLTFNSLEFCDNLLTFLGCRHLESDEKKVTNDMWIKLGHFATNMFRIVPSFHFMYGSFEPGAVEMKKRMQKVKDKEGPVKATVPKSVDIDKCTDEQESTTEEVERVLGIIHKLYKDQEYSPLDYFECVVNPNSFSHTVENMFHVSFLVKDGAVKLYFDEEQLPVIEPIISQEERASLICEKSSQAILSISVDEWKEIVKTFDIRHPAIPPRAKKRN